MQKAAQDNSVKILLAATTGGHLTEGLQLFAELPGVEMVILTEDSNRSRGLSNAYTYRQLWGGPAGAVLGAFLQAIKIILKERPQWVVTTGAECGIGACFAALLLRKKTIFVETACRYRSKSKSAKIIYPFVKVFLVQHEESLQLFGKKAQYIGGIFR